MALLGSIMVLIVTKLIGTGVCSNIGAGAGFSSDKQQVIPQRCYNAIVYSISDQEGLVQLGVAQSSSELKKVLGISVSASGSYGAFSAEAKANYVRSIEEKDNSISLNYYQYARNKVTVQILGHGEEAIIESFRDYYNGGKNPYFGLTCGDYYIGSYRQGAVLAMGLKIEFSSSHAKTEFMAKVGASFGDIVSASASVESAVTEYNIKGSVTMHAFQMGGAPGKLGNILSSGDSSEYYALACSLTAMDKCIKAAGGLLDYAKNQFSNQFSTLKNTGLTPLGIAFAELIPIKYIGLNPPASLVTPEVKQCRNALFSKLMENEYYQQKLYPFLNGGYPGQLNNNFLEKASFVLSKADRNVDILMQAHGGAADCFNFPEECKSIKAVIGSHLQNITANDLKFLEQFKYILTTRGGLFFRETEGPSGTTWRAVSIYEPEEGLLLHASSVNVTEEEYSYLTIVLTPMLEVMGYHYHDAKPTIISPDGSITYSGVLQNVLLNSNTKNYKEYKLISPFFFDVYNITQQSRRYQMNK